MSKLIAGCTFTEANRTFQFGQEVNPKLIDSDRLKVLMNLPGWEDKKMVYEVGDSSPKAPDNKASKPDEAKVPKQEPVDDNGPEFDEDDEILQKATLKNLRKLAKELKIRNYTKLERKDLIKAIKEAETEDEDDDE